jgi:hypothetical protein
MESIAAVVKDQFAWLASEFPAKSLTPGETVAM